MNGEMKTMTQKRALVLSIDAMTDLDLEIAKAYPHFSEILSHCALATNVEAIFPSLTYPCHVAMATGCTPMHTGIYNNESFLPDTFHRPWYFYASQIARPTIFAFAAKAGISTGCVMWPCMGKGPIDTLVPEIWGETPDAPFLEPFCSAGSETFIREIWPAVGKIAHGFHQPEFDAFVCRIAEEVIRRRSPEMLYVHMCQIDNVKHYRGLNSPERIRAIENTDALLGRLLTVLEQEGLREDTHVVLCSDHGQMPVERVSYPNRLLAAHGLLSAGDSGAILHWQSQVQSACLSAFLYAENARAERRALSLLQENSAALGIAHILPRAECPAEFHLDGTFSAVLLGTPGTYFHNAADSGVLMDRGENGPLPYRANHGHDPRLGEKPFFLISGRDAAVGMRIDHGFRLIDEAPTVAALMGFEMPGVDGQACTCLLR